MKNVALLAILCLGVSANSCKKSADEAPLLDVYSQANEPFYLKEKQSARIETSGNVIQMTLLDLGDCRNDGYMVGTSTMDIHVAQGPESENIRIILPNCSNQKGDSLATARTKNGSTILVNAIEYENKIGAAKGLKAKLTIK